MPKKYWEFKNVLGNESADLYIYNEISDWDDESYTSAQSFKDDLDGIGEVKNINLFINSPGGSVSDGLAIASMLKRNKAFVTAQIDGLACSIASVIACSADKVVMRGNCMMMIHNALAGGFMYDNAKGYRKLANDLDKISESLRMTYIEKSNGKITEEKLTELMDAESWLTAKECLELGLCDEIIESNKAVASISNKFKSFFNNVPSDVVVEDEIDNEEVIITEDEEIEDVENPIEESEGVDDVEQVDEDPKEDIIDKLEKATNEIIKLNEIISNMQLIVDEYNQLKAKKDEEEYKEELKNKVSFYKNKFEALGAKDKFETDEVQGLLKTCVKDKESLLALNLMVVEMIDNKNIETKVVQKSITEKISKIENLIPLANSVEEKYGFK